MDINDLKDIIIKAKSFDDLQHLVASFEVEDESNPYLAKAKEVLAYLNEQTNQKKLTTTVKIQNRLRDGYNVDQLKAIIDIKVDQWANIDKMVGYLHPTTLFRSAAKVEGYWDEVKLIKSYHKNVSEQKQIATVRPRADW